MNFLINAAFEQLRMGCLLEGSVYFTLPFPNVAFIRGCVYERVAFKRVIRYINKRES